MLKLLDNRKVFGIPDVTAKQMPYFNSLIPVTIILGVYLYFSNSWGVSYMKTKRPVNLRKCLIVYDLLQIIGCAYTTILTLPFLLKMNWRCGEITPNEATFQEINILIIYHLMKILDLFESVFHVLSKRYDYLNCAHIYHHATMVIITWLIIRYAPGGHSLFLPLINGIFNIIKYSSYFTTAYFKSKAMCLFWRNNVAEMQMVQFCIVIVVYIQPFLKQGCTFPKELLVIGLIQVVILIWLTIYYYLLLHTS